MSDFMSPGSELPPELRRPFVELLYSVPERFHFFRAVQVTLHDVNFNQQQRWFKYPADSGIDKFTARPPEYPSDDIPV